MAKDPKPYYVYELIDPRNGQTFYVGKGKNGRDSEHEVEARSTSQSRKCLLIRDIWAENLQITRRRIKEFTHEADAYDFEKARIKHHGLKNLTNILPGGGTPRFLDPDIEAVRLVKHIYYKTMGFSENYVADHKGEEVPVGPFFGRCCYNLMLSLIRKRGAEWFASEMSGNPQNAVICG